VRTTVRPRLVGRFAATLARMSVVHFIAPLGLCLVLLPGCGSDTDDVMSDSVVTETDESAAESASLNSTDASGNGPQQQTATQLRAVESSDSAESQASRVSTEPVPENPPEVAEPTAEEIARTVELETELEQLVAMALEALEPQQAELLLRKVDQWNQIGYGCSEGPDRAACQQYHIRSRIQELNNRMRGFSTEY